MYFADGSTSYWKCGGTGSHIWRNGSDVSRAELDTSGNFIAEGNITAYGSASDIRIKENIEIIPDSVEKVKSLRGVTFNYKKNGKRSTGLVAQELQKVLPEAVYETKDSAEDGEDILAIRYGNVVGLLVEAIKEQQTQLTAQQEQINQLTNLVNKLMEK
jgi:fructose/tagatose bisphosphate aldolase